MLFLDPSQLAALTEKARNSRRQRINQNFHATLADPISRLAIAMEPDSYVRPHRHADRWELLIALHGAFDVVVFDDDGTVNARHRLSLSEGVSVLEFPANTWHSLVSLAPGSVFFEVKSGPYVPVGGADWMAWAPAEGEAGVPECLEFLKSSRIGQRFVAKRRSRPGASR
jgi:cupin fold WbuC family metalloprotein